MASEKTPQRLSDNFMFPKLFQAFKIAVQPGKLIVALLGLMAICLTGYIMDLSGTVVVGSPGGKTVTELQAYVDSNSPPVQVVCEFREKHRDEGSGAGVFSTLWRFGSGRFHSAIRNLFNLNFASVVDDISCFLKGLVWAIRFHYAYCLIFVILMLAILSVTGGAICRMAAMQFALGERTGIMAALRFGFARFTSFFFAPVLPIIGIGFFAAGIFIWGL
ncbi:MAG: hypothetical protein ACYS8Z_07555 [Planctomycetota bacterium]